MVLAGFAWLGTGLFSSDVPGRLHRRRARSGVVSYGFLVHMLVAFPRGAVRGRLDRFVVVGRLRGRHASGS